MDADLEKNSCISVEELRKCWSDEKTDFDAKVIDVKSTAFSKHVYGVIERKKDKLSGQVTGFYLVYPISIERTMIKFIQLFWLNGQNPLSVAEVVNSPFIYECRPGSSRSVGSCSVLTNYTGLFY